MSKPLEKTLDALRRLGLNPKSSGSGWSSRCPSHEDKSPSLSVSTGDDGKILFHCHAGCEQQDILSALELEWSDLFPDSDNGRPGRRPQERNSTKTWPTVKDAIRDLCRGGGCGGAWAYRNADGSPALAVVRVNGKDGRKSFRQLSPAVGGSWKLGAPHGPRPLYSLPELIVSTADTVYIAEGEKCVDALVQLGLTATTSPGGARASEKADWSLLAGKNVVILPDADEPGFAYAIAVTKLLVKLDPPATVSKLLLPGLGEGEDVFDWIARRREAGMEDEDIGEEFCRFEPVRVENQKVRSSLILSGWEPLPGNWLREKPPSTPYLLRMPTRNGNPVQMPSTNGDGFLARGRVGALSAASYAGKTQAAIQAAVASVTRRRFLDYFPIDHDPVGKAVLILAENDEKSARGRLYWICQGMGLSEEELALVERNVIVRAMHGKGPCRLFHEEQGGAVGCTAEFHGLHEGLLREDGVSLVVLDTWARLAGCEVETRNQLSTQAVQYLEQLTQVPGSPFILVLGHSSKFARRTGTADARGVTGFVDAARWSASLVCEGDRVLLQDHHQNDGPDMLEPLSLVRGEHGVLTAEREVDRQAREEAGRGRVAEEHEEHVDRVHKALLENGENTSQASICKLANIKATDGRAAIATAISRGLIERSGNTRNTLYKAVPK